ncbi:MAG: hypothetical protein FJZ01_12350 [Candidatus Sericytochromatia bacterium]|nr:hypothetical protein [Candidatus Tanganyikabacteria bacterium]
MNPVGGQKAAQAVNSGVGYFRQGVQQALYGVSYREFETGGTLEAPSPANAPSPDDVRVSRLALEAGAGAEQAALGKLAAADRDRYGHVAAPLAGRPVARQALQGLLTEGTLTGSRDLAGGQSLLQHLDALATRPLARGIDRQDLLAEVVAEIGNPTCIKQGNRNSCVATTASIALARHNPAEYARLVAGLAAPGGSVRMAGGNALTRPDGWDFADDGGRTTSARLLQSALLAEGAKVGSYDPRTDTFSAGPVPLGAGLTGGGSARINSQLQGRPFETFTSKSFSRGWDRVTEALAAGKGPFPVGLQWGSGGAHEVLLEKIEGDWAIFVNPSGHRQRLGVAEFRSHLRNAEIPE